MATVHHIPPSPHVDEPDTVFGRLARLLRLEVELGVAEGRELVRSLVVAIAIIVPAAFALIASIVVLLAGAVAPLFGARWEHFVIAGGGVFLLAAAALAWSGWRLRSLPWPKQTLASFEENWRWLGAQLRSRLTLR
jgi:hypothetical protein